MSGYENRYCDAVVEWIYHELGTTPVTSLTQVVEIIMKDFYVIKKHPGWHEALQDSEPV